MAASKRLRLDRFAVQSWRERTEVLRAELAAARAELDPDAVHDLRVAIRRLRACLDVFPSVWPRRRARRLKRRFRRLFQQAGEVRDADIALQSDPGGHNRRLLKRRSRQARDLRKLLRRGRVKKLLRSVRRIDRRAKKDRRDAHSVAVCILSQRLRGLFEQGREAAAAEAPPPELHRLRIAVKKTRYAVELLLPLLGSCASATVDDLEGLQTLLGEIQDCATTLRLLPAGETADREAIGVRQQELRKRFFDDWKQRLDAPGALERRLLDLGAATAPLEAT